MSFNSPACLRFRPYPSRANSGASYQFKNLNHAVRLFATVTGVAITLPAHASMALLQPAREAAANEPLELTLLVTDDDSRPLTVTLPATLRVTLTNGDAAPAPLELPREPSLPDHLTLRPGEFRKVHFRAPWPDSARGAVRIDPVGFDASPSLVVLNRGPNQDAVASTERAESKATSRAQVAAIAATDKDIAVAPAADSLSTIGRSTLARLSYYEPMYVGVGTNGDTTARFQFSFKYRLMMPDDPRSKRFLDNLYFAYTQNSIWDLSATSAPFRDTSYMPQLFYYIPDTGWKSALFSRMGISAGIGHESNGQAGPESRGINTVFVRPTWEFGDVTGYHTTVSPKLYYYLTKSGNEDIADYRGYMDLLIKYGSPDGWQLATTLRKGTHHWYGSVDTQLTYPLARLLGSKWGGYLWVGYFNGYGEDLLDYNQRQHWIARIGYSIAR
ncbi:phospholipase A [Paraburkholderia acidisoli]|uniref:Phospholipase A1 n=1 Tax=Paraburkholderia acidisoli TaxID=2571748 RepID=A0A7Z2JL59_9BURK|nr:phospholipase A [Paraburkholderia acidisoli]QGZ67044.1 phospholipase [Paraburkholderia acidisoli]